jgi:hypothetical protein
MGKVFFSVTMSLDGFIAPEFMQLGQPVDKWLSQWLELQHYVFQQRFFRESLKRALPYAGLCLDQGGSQSLGAPGRDYVPLRQRRNRERLAAGARVCATQFVAGEPRDDNSRR